MPKRHDNTGRSTTERFSSLPHYMTGSPAWRALSPVAVKILIGVMRLYNGGNNGRLAMPSRAAAREANCSKDSAARALRELVEKGFLELAIEGRFDRKTRHASEYRLTLYPCDRAHAPATKAFMRWGQSAVKKKHGPITGTDSPIART